MWTKHNSDIWALDLYVEILTLFRIDITIRTKIKKIYEYAGTCS